MDVFHWPGGSAPSFDASVATLGVFDGVHLGHQRILREVVAQARARGLTALAITLVRHPHSVVGGPPEAFITSLSHRVRLFEALGLDVCMALDFTPEVAGMEASDFAAQALRDVVRARVLIVGPDCRFGRGGRGDIGLLERLGPELGFEARALGPVEAGGEVVSSTGVRRAVREADLARAQRLLGRPFSVLGRVVEGARRGRALGYPTANLDPEGELLPRDGVYAGVLLEGGRSHPSVAAVGYQSTFEPGPETPVPVEVHVLEGQLDLYGRQVEVQFARYLREQRRFESAEALREQIERDVAAAREALG